MQYIANLSHRGAAEAVAARIDWKYVLGMDLSDPGFDFSVLSSFRSRLLNGSKEKLFLDKLLERCQQLQLIKAKGKARTDSTHVLAAIRLFAWFEGVPLAKTRVSSFAKLAPN